MRWLIVLLATGCQTVELADREAAFVHDGDERVLCGVGVDGDDIELPEIEHAMQRALATNRVLLLFAHHPSISIDPRRVIDVLDTAARVGLPFITFPELATQRGRAGLSFAFDDNYVDDWMALRDGLRGRPVTFFVSNWDALSADQISALHELAGDGHAIEAHGMGHRDAMLYVDKHGIAEYVAREIDPLLAAMREAGFAPTTFAYPYGTRTTELDDALLERFQLVRSLTYLDASALAEAPCPY